MTAQPLKPKSETDGSLTAFRRKVYLAALAVGVLASLANLYFTGNAKFPDPYEQLVLPLVVLMSSALFMILWRFQRAQPLVETGMCLMASASLLSRLYFGLYVISNPLGPTVELSVLAAWIPIIYILNFLIMRSQLALWFSVFSYLAMVSISLPHMIAGFDLQVGNGEVFILIQMYASQLIEILLLLVLIGLRERYAASRALAGLMSEMALTDALTGLPNRRQIQSALEQEIHRAGRGLGPLAVMLFDMDHFKKINDSFGHPIGDRVLTEIGARLRLTLRGSDQLGRWGGEEFLIVAPDTSDVQAVLLAEKLRHLIEGEPVAGAGTVTASFGATSYHPGESAEALIHRADEALYRAKQCGRNRVEVA